MNKTISLIVRQAVVAGLYVALTLLNFQFSYGDIQFRIAEVLVFLCFFKKDYVIGLTLGCFIANLFSPMLFYDITFGTLATLISCLLIAFSKNIFVAGIYPVVFNGLLVGLELMICYDLNFWVAALEVAAGELGVMVIGALMFFFLKKNKYFMYVITLDKSYLNKSNDDENDDDVDDDDTATEILNEQNNN